MRMFKIILMILLFVFRGDCFCAAGEVLKLATTTSTYETGLLDYILPPFEEKHNIKIHIISVGTGKAVKLGQNGDVDIILVHAREAEDAFVEQGYGVNRRDVMYNDFVILGPADDPAGAAGLDQAQQALKKIFLTKQKFVSRGDDSGTHKKEKFLWSKINLEPQGRWYLEVGQGMSAALRIADEKNAYCLIDRATYLFNKDKIRLKIMVEADKDLLNPYGVIAVNPAKHPHIKYQKALDLINWLISPQCQKMIGDYRINNNKLYHPNIVSFQ
ncbi:MAG: substrate-binding domain-containing protein [Candidatus Omnitrophica bacterium]|nr:substrate-binding domain-containing protein [Candidatus Omnitrophota bacterium]